MILMFMIIKKKSEISLKERSILNRVYDTRTDKTKELTN